MTVTLQTTGRPVFVFVTSGTNYAAALAARWYSAPSYGADAMFKILRDGTQVYKTELSMYVYPTSTDMTIYAPPGCVSYLDTPPAGTHTYTFWASGGDPYTAVYVIDCALVAFEL
jgi:hypothetical protein